MTTTQTLRPAVAALVEYLDAVPNRGIDAVQAAWHPTKPARRFSESTIREAGRLGVAKVQFDYAGRGYAMSTKAD